jgi:BirA family biotin operon repressor/biotin-[acetyl-CoA-carboxylase] ligase
MDLKEQVLKELENHKGEYVSGGKLAETLHFSRNAVWKAVKSLVADGHDIQAVTNKGYRLSPDSDVLTAAAVEKHLGALAGVFDIDYRATVTSTNSVLKDLAAGGAREGTVVAAITQTAGRGRFGRSFYSPADSGVYFSVLLRPGVGAPDATLLTTAAAVAVARAVEDVTGAPARIKWVNDVYCGGKKVCGILTEGAFNMESGAMDYAVVGIGVNVAPPPGGFPADLSAVATSVCGQDNAAAGVRARLIAGILIRFWDYYQNLSGKAFLAEYKARSLVVGHDVDVVAAGATRPARALEIDDGCRLVVRFEDGEVRALSSGEVSIRPRSTSL